MKMEWGGQGVKGGEEQVHVTLMKSRKHDDLLNEFNWFQKEKKISSQITFHFHSESQKIQFNPIQPDPIQYDLFITKSKPPQLDINHATNSGEPPSQKKEKGRKKKDKRKGKRKSAIEKSF